MEKKKNSRISSSKIELWRYSFESFFWTKIWSLSFHILICNVEINFLKHPCLGKHSILWRGCAIVCQKHDCTPHRTPPAQGGHW